MWCDTTEREQRVNCTTEQLIPESLPTKPKISEPITVVWQQCDHSCNTRASSFCSPENVGEQGYVVDHGFWWSDGTTSLLQKCVNPVQRSEATKNKNTKQDHHKINELDHTRWPPTLLHREPTFNCTPTQLDPYIQPISRRRISWVGICRNAIDKKIDFHVKS